MILKLVYPAKELSKDKSSHLNSWTMPEGTSLRRMKPLQMVVYIDFSFKLPNIYIYRHSPIVSQSGSTFHNYWAELQHTTLVRAMAMFKSSSSKSTNSLFLDNCLASVWFHGFTISLFYLFVFWKLYFILPHLIFSFKFIWIFFFSKCAFYYVIDILEKDHYCIQNENLI